ncbi:hypothetical protein BDV3_003621 [Batrachochytrium dendrobatidis]
MTNVQFVPFTAVENRPSSRSSFQDIFDCYARTESSSGIYNHTCSTIQPELKSMSSALTLVDECSISNVRCVANSTSRERFNQLLCASSKGAYRPAKHYGRRTANSFNKVLGHTSNSVETTAENLLNKHLSNIISKPDTASIDEHELDNSQIMLAKQAFYFLEQSAHASKNKQLTQSQSSIITMTSAEPTYSAGDKKMDELLASYISLRLHVPRNDQTAFSKTPTSVAGDAVVPEPGHMRRQSSLSPTSYHAHNQYATTDQKKSLKPSTIALQAPTRMISKQYDCSLATLDEHGSIQGEMLVDRNLYTLNQHSSPTCNNQGSSEMPASRHLRRMESDSTISTAISKHDYSFKLANKANRYAPITTYSNQPTQFRNEQALWDSKEDDDTASNISFQERDYYGPQMTPQLKNEITHFDAQVLLAEVLLVIYTFLDVSGSYARGMRPTGFMSFSSKSSRIYSQLALKSKESVASLKSEQGSTVYNKDRCTKMFTDYEATSCANSEILQKPQKRSSAMKRFSGVANQIKSQVSSFFYNRPLSIHPHFDFSNAAYHPIRSSSAASTNADSPVDGANRTTQSLKILSNAESTDPALLTELYQEASIRYSHLKATLGTVRFATVQQLKTRDDLGYFSERGTHLCNPMLLQHLSSNDISWMNNTIQSLSSDAFVDLFFDVVVADFSFPDALEKYCTKR